MPLRHCWPNVFHKVVAQVRCAKPQRRVGADCGPAARIASLVRPVRVAPQLDLRRADKPIVTAPSCSRSVFERIRESEGALLSLWARAAGAHGGGSMIRSDSARPG